MGNTVAVNVGNSGAVAPISADIEAGGGGGGGGASAAPAAPAGGINVGNTTVEEEEEELGCLEKLGCFLCGG